MDSAASKYEVVFDLEAHRRIVRAGFRTHALAWLWSSLVFMGLVAVMATITAQLAFRFREAVAEWEAVLACTALGAVLSQIYFWLLASHRFQHAGIEEHGRVWQCEMERDVWTFVDDRGLARSYPWHLMKIESEHPEGWLIRCGDESLVVYRKPLQDAGLELEFRRRILDAASTPRASISTP